MNVWSLFSGVGGFDLGLERAGHSVTLQCEADEWRRSVLARHWPGVPCTTDVRQIASGRGWRRPGSLGGSGGQPDVECDGSSAPIEPAAIDLVCGGFPCQDLSVAGRRAGLAGERSGLFYEFARVADAVLPAGGWWLVENVPGLLSSNDGRDFAIILATMAELGFHDCAWRILDSRHFGVPQRRRRVFILARRARGDRAATVLLEPESGGGDFTPRRETGTSSTAASLSCLGNGGADDNDGQAGRFVTSHEHSPTLDRGAQDGPRRGQDAPFVAAVTRKWAKQSGGPAGDEAQNLVAFHLTQDPISGAEAPAMGRGNQQGCATIGTQTRDGVRRLTPRECERLQGFPDDWTLIDGSSDSRRYAAMGDAVTVNVIEWIGGRLAAVAG